MASSLTKRPLSSGMRTPVGVDVLLCDNEDDGLVLDQATLVLGDEDPDEEVVLETTLVHVEEVLQRGWRSGSKCCNVDRVLGARDPNVPQVLPHQVLQRLRGGDGRSSALLVPTRGLASSLGVNGPNVDDVFGAGDP